MTLRSFSISCENLRVAGTVLFLVKFMIRVYNIQMGYVIRWWGITIINNVTPILLIPSMNLNSSRISVSTSKRELFGDGMEPWPNSKANKSSAGMMLLDKL